MAPRNRTLSRSTALFTVLAVLLVALVPSLSYNAPGPAASSSLASALGGPGCGNSSNPCLVTFTETGLPTGSDWSVTVSSAGTNFSAGSSTVVFDLINNSYTFQVAPFSGYTPSPASGPFTVSGNDVNQAISFALPSYAVTFQESGLPGSTRWTVNLEGTIQSSSGSTDTFSETNGTYSYSVSSSDSRYTPSPATGSVTIGGGPETVSIAFSLVAYTVTFTETGFPLGTGPTWTVTLNGIPQSSSSSATITFSEANGTYPFTVSSSDLQYSPSPASGSISVIGQPKAVSVMFSLVTYSVTFTETGFPLHTGSTWTVMLNGVPLSTSTSTSLVFSEPNGTYPFTVQSSNGNYRPSPASGSVHVNGAAVPVPISFVPSLYPVYFNETGLGAGVTWSVSVNGGAPTSTSSASIVFFEFNGTYSYVVKSLNASYVPSPASGSLTVAGRYAAISVTFSLLTYPITFSEAGFPLKLGTWSVTLGGVVASSSTSHIFFNEPNGSYGWTVAPFSGWHANVYSGSVTVLGGGPTINVTWTRVVYNVWFNETGLPSGFLWGVTTNGTFRNSTVSSILYLLANDTYTFTIEKLSGYHADVYSGVMVISGSATNRTIVWTQVTYGLSFLESGLPAGKRWNVTVGLVNGSSTLPLITFNLPNGTYNFTISHPVGEYPTPPSGSVVVNGAARQVVIVFSYYVYAVSFNESGLVPGSTWAVTLDGVRLTSNTSSITTLEGNGSYSYLVDRLTGYTFSPTGGSFRIAGAPDTINITFALQTYAVEFYATGLTASDNWSVTVGSTTNIGLGTQAIVFAEPNGTFPFAIAALSLFLPVKASLNLTCAQTVTIPVGNLTVCGRTLLISVAFYPVPGYPVTFSEQGLGPGVGWSVAVGGLVVFGSTPTIVVNIPNGTYTYYLGYVPGYTTPVSSGVLFVSMNPVLISVSFLKAGGPYLGPPRGFSLFEWALLGAGSLAAALLLIVLLVRRRNRAPDVRT